MRKSNSKKNPFSISDDGRFYHFIILKNDYKAIWKRPFVSYEEANAELTAKGLANYHIEKRANQFQHWDSDGIRPKEIDVENEFDGW